MAHLGGVSEIGELLKVSRQQVGNLRERPDFPEPVAEIAQGPIWDMADVQRWLESGARRGPGRPAANERVVGGRFLLDPSPVGRGGFGEVYRAVDRKTGEVVAIKVLKDIDNVDAEAIVRFRRELRLMEESLDHPHVLKVIAHGDFSDRDSIWSAMPLAVASLDDEISAMKDNVPMVVDLARQICAGVAHIHERGVLHRDLKPGNILRNIEGVWVITDFGLAREDERLSAALTSTLRQGMGTYVYASPEQMSNPKNANRRDDVYSIGKILQHAITGVFPLVSAYEIPDSPLRPVIQRATGARDNRYESVTDLMDAIVQAVDLYSSNWEEPADRLSRLRPRVASDVLDPLAAEELLTWLVSDAIDEEMDSAGRAFVNASRASLSHMWGSNPDAFRTAYSHVSRWIRSSGFEFTYCDNIANTIEVVVTLTQDNDILRFAVGDLAELARNHNRWHVQDVLVSMLQAIRGAEQALVAIEGLRAVDRAKVSWSISEFGARAMHPVLRQGILTMVQGVSKAS